MGGGGTRATNNAGKKGAKGATAEPVKKGAKRGRDEEAPGEKDKRGKGMSGDKFAAKNAKGDVRKKGVTVQPYAYQALDPRQLNVSFLKPSTPTSKLTPPRPSFVVSSRQRLPPRPWLSALTTSLFSPAGQEARPGRREVRGAGQHRQANQVRDRVSLRATCSPETRQRLIVHVCG
jgi:hypothetical protein